jgi:hypothetical protein
MTKHLPTNATRIEGFPKRSLARARAELVKAHARMVRAAKRQGAEAPAAPSLEVLAERVEAQCSECGAGEFVDRAAHGRACEGVLVTRVVVDLEINAPRPSLDGWEFLAVVEPLTAAVPGIGKNLIRQVPGAIVAEGELVRWYDADLACDHCCAARRRAETFVVRHEDGSYRQVGRQCLAAFLGGKSAAAIIAALAYPTIVRAAGEGDGGGWGGDPVFDHVEFLIWVTASVRISGWVSRAASRESLEGKTSTADHARYLLTPPGPSGMSQWKRTREIFTPTEGDKERAAAALVWAKSLAGATDYERNLVLVALQPHLESSHLGVMASVIPAHARILGEEIARRECGESAHVGAVGDKGRDFGRVVLERVFAIDTQYGALHIHTFRDAAGNVLVWRTSESKGGPGDEFELVGTVKAHGEYKGVKQTDLTRCRLASLDRPIVVAG